MRPYCYKMNVFVMFISTLEMYMFDTLSNAVCLNQSYRHTICMIFCYSIQIQIVIGCLRRFTGEEISFLTPRLYPKAHSTMVDLPQQTKYYASGEIVKRHLKGEMPGKITRTGSGQHYRKSADLNAFLNRMCIDMVN